MQDFFESVDHLKVIYMVKYNTSCRWISQANILNVMKNDCSLFSRVEFIGVTDEVYDFPEGGAI